MPTGNGRLLRPDVVLTGVTVPEIVLTTYAVLPEREIATAAGD
jgi:hypothetical protein